MTQTLVVLCDFETGTDIAVSARPVHLQTTFAHIVSATILGKWFNCTCCFGTISLEHAGGPGRGGGGWMQPSGALVGIGTLQQ